MCIVAVLREMNVSDIRRCNDRPYHHGDLRQTLLDTCCQHIAGQGLEGLSLRALAREAGVSATAPYRHFETRQALLSALATEGFTELTRALAGARLQWHEEPIRALYVAGTRYVRYAVANPVKYQLMFGDLIGEFSGHQPLVDAAWNCFAEMRQILVAGGRLQLWVDTDLEELAAQLWAMLHGIAGLVISYQRKCQQIPTELLAAPPLVAQRKLALAPEKALLRFLRGVVRDPANVASLEAQEG